MRTHKSKSWIARNPLLPMRLNQCVLAQLTGDLVRLAVRRNNYTVESYAVPGRSRPPSAHTSGTPIITPNLLREPKRWTICSQAWLDFVIEIQTHDTSSESKSGFCQNQRYPIVVSVAPPHWEQFKPFFYAPSSSTFGSRLIPPPIIHTFYPMSQNTSLLPT